MAKFNLTRVGEVTVLHVSGLLTHANSCNFRLMLEDALGESDAAPLIVDLTGLEFICSTGMRLLVQYQRLFEETDRRMVTTGLSGTVAETMEICGIDKLLTTSGSVSAAFGDMPTG